MTEVRSRDMLFQSDGRAIVRRMTILMLICSSLLVGTASAHGPGDYKEELREVRALVQRGALVEALEVVHHIEVRAPYVEIVGRATFWRAFILLRIGDARSVREALAAATKLIEEVPQVAIEMETRALLDRLRTALVEFDESLGVSDVDVLTKTLQDHIANREESSP